MSRDSRDLILGRVRRALKAADDAPKRRVAVQGRLGSHPAHIIPARARESREAILARFRHMLEGQGATVVNVESPQHLPELIAGYLRARNLPASLRLGSSPYLAALPWARAPGMQLQSGAATASDEVSLSKAFTASGETGTLIMVSGPENPVTLNFLPETAIVVIEEADIDGAYEDAWKRIRAAYGERSMPRTVNMISGPSRTADIEQTLVTGAHGPRALHVLVVKSQ